MTAGIEDARTRIPLRIIAAVLLAACVAGNCQTPPGDTSSTAAQQYLVTFEPSDAFKPEKAQQLHDALRAALPPGAPISRFFCRPKNGKLIGDVFVDEAGKDAVKAALEQNAQLRLLQVETASAELLSRMQEMHADASASDAATTDPAAAMCRDNLARIDAAKAQLQLDEALQSGTPVTMDKLLEVRDPKTAQPMLPQEPACPDGGSYTPNAIGDKPACSLGAAKGHELP